MVARTPQGVIGCDNRLPWRLRSDLKRFRALTLHHAVIMGRKTFESIGKPLPKRENIVVSRASSLGVDGVTVCPDIATALRHADAWSLANGRDRVFVIGGEALFTALQDAVDCVHLTEVEADIPGDVFFRMAFPPAEWRASVPERVARSEDDEFGSVYRRFDRIEPRRRTQGAAA
ncbi:Dihydrofolate reductase [Blastochloris viridis]|uniref:Dihydrofolate reductase n=1 Tax=Blastochloris viridis TaxID=1079 RepID=A0A0S4Q668_BLAVI|nr:Dihydrofolate reductase [Blastochloris viridis]